MTLIFLRFVATALVMTGAIALGLIVSQRPGPVAAGAGLDFTGTLRGGRPEPMPLTQVTMRDGYPLQVRDYPGPSADAPLLILIHGSGWHGMQFDGLARQLSARAHVVVPDLRGHGPKPGRRGDIDHLGQYEDDLADLIKATVTGGQKVVLGGHSSGGGLVVRMAGGPYGVLMDGAVLMAPFLKYNAPVTRENAGGWAQPLTRRIIGLSMLNAFRIRALNHLTVMQFRMPQMVLDGPLGETATTAYSYRLNTSFAPRGRYLQDVAALPPFVLIAGSADEAFDAAGYEGLMTTVTDKGRYTVVPGVAHLDIVDAVQTVTRIEEFLDEL